MSKLSWAFVVFIPLAAMSGQPENAQIDRIERKLDQVIELLKARPATDEPKYSIKKDMAHLPWFKYPQIEQEGKDAYYDGKEDSECPYGNDDPERRSAWLHGHGYYIGG